MSGQIEDDFLYRDVTYAVAGISDRGLFDIGRLGLQPTMPHTACSRGYLAVFGLVESQLVLHTLHVHLLKPGPGFERRPGPVINGVTPTPSRDRDDLFNNHYEGLDLPLDYTGGLLLAAGFIQELYVHMGFQAPWKYQRVVELIFDAGTLTAAHDRSEEMAAIRRRVVASGGRGEFGESGRDADVVAWIERAFDRRY